MAQSPLSLSIFFPAYNEEANISESVRAAERIARELTPVYEIIIVNDGSRDQTGAIAEALAHDNAHIRVVHHTPNQGYGAAVWSGLQAARYDYVFFTDADLQFDLRELKKLARYIPEYQAVIGYRAKRRDPFMRLVNAKGWGLLNRLLFGLQVRDIDCAFKLFDRRVVANLPIKSRGAMMSAELLIHLQRQGITIKEVPVTHLPRKAGSPTGAKLSVIARAFQELYQAYRGDLGSVTQRQIIKFMMVGAVNTVLDVGLYLLFTRTIPLLQESVLAAKGLSYGLATISSFFLNRHWTFRRTGRIHASEVIRFYLTAGTAIGMNVLILAIALRLFHANDLLAVIVATTLTFVWNFSLSKFWVFSAKRHARPLAIPPVDSLLLVALIAAAGAAAYVWMQADRFPPHWDMANHLKNSLDYADEFRALAQSSSAYDTLRHAYRLLVGIYTYYPPLTYWASVPFITFFGRTIEAALATNLVFIAILIVSTYGLGVKLWNRTTGILAALVIVSYPFLISQFHEFQLDMPFTAMISLSLWALLQTNRWQNQTWSFLFGAIVGLAMLTKWTVPAFLAGPVCYLLWEQIRSIRLAPPFERTQLWRQLGKGLMLSVGGLLLVAGPWYGLHADRLMADLQGNWHIGTSEADPPVRSIESVRYYFIALVTAHLRLLLLIPLAVGILTTLLRRKNLRRNAVLLVFILSSYAIMTLYNNKDYRFIEPVLIGTALLSTYWITQLIRPARVVATLLLFGIAIFHTLSVNWGPTLFPGLPPRVLIPVWAGSITLDIPLWEFRGYTGAQPRQANWRQSEVVAAIYRDAPAGLPPTVAAYYPDTMEFNRENLEYAARQAEYPMRLLRGRTQPGNCATINYIIATSREGVAPHVPRDFPYYNRYVYDDTKPYPESTPGQRNHQPGCRLDPVYTAPLPDTSEVYVWKVTPR